MNISRLGMTCGVVVSLGTMSVFSPPALAQQSPTITIVATGLHNPRGLNFAPNGGLYVAEAGANGVATSDCGMMSDHIIKCTASTGSVAKIDLASGTVTRVLTGLPSLLAPDGTASAGSGPYAVSFQGMSGYVTIGLGLNPSLRQRYLGDAGANYGRIVRFNPSDGISAGADLAAYEAANDPDHAGPDSNPYGLVALPGRVVVADAGANDLLEIKANGVISTLAVFPRVNRPQSSVPPSVQAVPTSVALAPDGNLYVGVLTGGPFTVGIASVYRVPSGGGVPEAAYTGFTNVVGIAFGPDGSLYVLELARTAIPHFGDGGRLVRIWPDGTRADVAKGSSFFAPGGLAVGRDGAVYVTVNSISATDGEVLKIVQ